MCDILCLRHYDEIIRSLSSENERKALIMLRKAGILDSSIVLPILWGNIKDETERESLLNYLIKFDLCCKYSDPESMNKSLYSVPALFPKASKTDIEDAYKRLPDFASLRFRFAHRADHAETAHLNREDRTYAPPALYYSLVCNLVHTTQRVEKLYSECCVLQDYHHLYLLRFSRSDHYIELAVKIDEAEDCAVMYEKLYTLLSNLCVHFGLEVWAEIQHDDCAGWVPMDTYRCSECREKQKSKCLSWTEYPVPSSFRDFRRSTSNESFTLSVDTVPAAPVPYHSDEQSGNEGYDVFISYRRMQKAKAKLLADGFKTSGYNVFWDLDSECIPLGNFQNHLEEALENVKVVIVLISKAPSAPSGDERFSKSSMEVIKMKRDVGDIDYCALEIENALRKRKVVVPVYEVEDGEQWLGKQLGLVSHIEGLKELREKNAVPWSVREFNYYFAKLEKKVRNKLNILKRKYDVMDGKRSHCF
jgi:hypothetical protein